MLLYHALFALHAKVVPYLNVQLEGASLSNGLFDKTVTATDRVRVTKGFTLIEDGRLLIIIEAKKTVNSDILFVDYRTFNIIIGII